MILCFDELLEGSYYSLQVSINSILTPQDCNTGYGILEAENHPDKSMVNSNGHNKADYSTSSQSKTRSYS